PDGKISVDYGVWGIPEAFFISPSGRITYKHIGAIPPPLLAAKLQEARRDLVSTGSGRGEHQAIR
ncbi:MAG: hypothetical protein OXE53_10475, partial [Deltaproteobacteria bacterium]|nr:hypothetical protein [Deltaproteobacteria bacterium]